MTRKMAGLPGLRRQAKSLEDASGSSNISASLKTTTGQIHFGVEAMTTTHFTTRLLCGLAVLLMLATAATAQPATGTVKRLVLHSAVLGEDRLVLIRTPAGYESNKVS